MSPGATSSPIALSWSPSPSHHRGLGCGPSPRGSPIPAPSTPFLGGYTLPTCHLLPSASGPHSIVPLARPLPGPTGPSAKPSMLFLSLQGPPTSQRPTPCLTPLSPQHLHRLLQLHSACPPPRPATECEAALPALPGLDLFPRTTLFWPLLTRFLLGCRSLLPCSGFLLGSVPHSGHFCIRLCPHPLSLAPSGPAPAPLDQIPA